MLIDLGQGPGNSRVALDTLLCRERFWENISIKSREVWECYTDLRDNYCGRLEDIPSGYWHKRTKLPYLGNLAIMPMESSYPIVVPKLPYLHRQSYS